MSDKEQRCPHCGAEMILYSHSDMKGRSPSTASAFVAGRARGGAAGEAGGLAEEGSVNDYNELVNSYLEAARVMGDDRAHVEIAVSLACRFSGKCPSCRHSRAPQNVVKVARQEGRLEIYKRKCSQGYLTGLNRCPLWEQLEIPIEMEVM